VDSFSSDVREFGLGVLSAQSNGFIVSKTERTVIRKCPFCGASIEDLLGKDINFIVHLGKWSPEHQAKQDWADYVTRMNRI